MRVMLFSENPKLRDNFADLVSDGVGRDSVNGVATGYEMDGPDLIIRWGGARFSAPIQAGPGTCPTSRKMGNGNLS